jgi:hypothetical protein
MDIKHFPQGLGGWNYALICVDHLTIYVISVALKKTDAINVCDAITKYVVLSHGAPEVVISDKDPAINNQLMDREFKNLGIKLKCISPGNHKGLLAERYIQTISNLITSNFMDKGQMWFKFLKSSTFAYNTFPLVGLKLSPYFLLHRSECNKLRDFEYNPISDL